MKHHDTNMTYGELYVALAEREKRIAAFEEREAACCPEDVGFDECIRSLEKKLAEREEKIAAQAKEIEALTKCRSFVDWAFTQFIVEGGGIDGSVQEKLQELEMLREELFDPEKHGGCECSEYMEPGVDVIYFLRDEFEEKP